MLAETTPSASGTPAAKEPDLVERVPHLDVAPETQSRVNVNVYADAHIERPNEQTERIRIVLPEYISECNVKVWLDVSSNLAIVGANQGSIRITRGNEQSTVAQFVVESSADALSDDDCFFAAYFSYNGRAAGKVERHARVADLGNLFAAREPQTIKIEPAAIPADINITVRNPKNNNTELSCSVQSPLVDEYRSEISDSWYPGRETGVLLSSLFAAFLKTSSYEERYQSLVGGGKQLFETLPERVQKLFWKLHDSGKTAKTMLIVSQEPYVPWELMIPTRRLQNGTTETLPPLGVTFAIGRWVLDNNAYYCPPQKMSATDSYVVAPIYPGATALDAAHDEAKFVCDNFSGTMISPATSTRFDYELGQSGRGIIHFACHGKIGEDIWIGRQILELQDSSFLDSTRLRGMNGVENGFNAKHPFVFINACNAGQPIVTLNGMGGLASTFIRLGASGVVAPLWNVDDTIAREIAIQFYGKIKNNPNITPAEIIREIRATSYGNTPLQGRDTYAAYCFYGDPNAVINFAPNP
jgi:CHAT domain